MARSKIQVAKPKENQRYGCGIAIKPLRMRVDPIVPRRKTRRSRKGIKRYQKSKKFLIPKISFEKLVREITAAFGFHKLQKNALKALQEVCEAYLVRLFNASNLCVIRAKRVTLRASDMQFARELMSYKI